MSDTYNFEEIEVELTPTTIIYVTGDADYEAEWSSGDFDYEGPQGTATHKVGFEMDGLEIEDVHIDSFWTVVLLIGKTTENGKEPDRWVDVGKVVDVDDIDKDLLPKLKELVKERLCNDTSLSEFAVEQGIGEPDYG